MFRYGVLPRNTLKLPLQLPPYPPPFINPYHKFPPLFTIPRHQYLPLFTNAHHIHPPPIVNTQHNLRPPLINAHHNHYPTFKNAHYNYPSVHRNARQNYADNHTHPRYSLIGSHSSHSSSEKNNFSHNFLMHSAERRKRRDKQAFPAKILTHAHLTKMKPKRGWEIPQNYWPYQAKLDPVPYRPPPYHRHYAPRSNGERYLISYHISSTDK